MYLLDLFKGQSNAPAICAPEMQAMTHGQLHEQVKKVAGILQSIGIKPGMRVASALKDGPSAAAAFLAVASTATAAPLNPGGKKAEFDASLVNLEADLLIVDEGSDTAAIESANELGIPVITLQESSEIAGKFSLYQDGDLLDAPAANNGFSRTDDTVLVLETSGTTGKPKVVPLTLENVAEQTKNIARSLELTEDDRGMGVVPLSHIHGIMGTIMTPLSVGSSVCYLPKFVTVARSITKIMADFKPTWITAVPTTHGAILQQMQRPKNAENVSEFASGVRIVRSASSALPDETYDQINLYFPNAVVVESLAMTENAHSIFSIPLDGPLKGSVGRSIGVDVAIMDSESERILPPGEVGELVIRGKSVVNGYHNNDAANESAFTSEGWFRTGDLLKMDEEGYGYVVGRIKEMIKTGAEQVAPAAVDNVLMEFAGVGQVMTFAIPDQKWGQIVGAAVVVKEGQQVCPDALKKFARHKLADFKVPREIVFVDEMPLGRTGKPDRLGAAAKLKDMGLLSFNP